MQNFHLVRVGAMGQVGRFSAIDATRYQRHHRVVVRTCRGLEVGEVLVPPESAQDAKPTNWARTSGHDLSPVPGKWEREEGSDGQILRGMTAQDQLLEARLETKRQAAYEACVKMLAEQGRNDLLIDVEHLFDGQGLYFYFLGEVSSDLEEQTSRLAEAYESKVQFRKFTETLIEGCGPDCGTEKAAGQGGCESCSGCSVASACGK